ncbi:hypothetical protein SERLADRAFT_432340 [Serpula lacrymans var. lacrymans S7.9]|uniref:Uncharacterized protein n=1 Tax=Serpula lacrymans var. lacrymans (strain S7.9) TaxID=578457 RepID=F8NCY2_SERL9|nr:uncharacterized protein SERLADRAFT_432340 [Serpula lacrymans var. lacrymans S7.9]EGO30726.1 hypothetical protein SERLADRAFT_432340 [Serpula lacrymans var. lacrymans S7.9]
MSEDPTTFLLKELHSTTPKTGQLEPSTTSPNDHENDENALALALWKDCPPPHAIDSDSSPQVPSKRPHDDNNPEGLPSRKVQVVYKNLNLPTTVVSRTEATPQPPQSAEQATLPGTIASNKSITWQPINPIPNPQLQLQPQPQPQLPLQQQQQQQPQPQPQPQPQLQPQPNSQVLPWMNGAQGRANLLATMSAYSTIYATTGVGKHAGQVAIPYNQGGFYPVPYHPYGVYSSSNKTK